MNGYQKTAEDIKAISDTFKTPPGFVEKPYGLIEPEKLINPNPQITVNGKVD